MNENVVTTNYARENQARAQAGLESIKPVVKMSFGDKGVTSDGTVVKPLSSDTQLGNKLLAKDIELITFPTPYTARYKCTLLTTDLVGYDISELGLEDAAGKLLARKTFRAQPKDGENEFTFEWDEAF